MSMRISHEAIYQALYIEARGALKRELVLCLRTGRALRVPRARARSKAWAHVTPEVMISERPDEADDRSVPGHWEGDLIIGLKRSAIGTIVDRTSRFTMLVHLPREDGYGTIPRTKNGPALAGYGAITMKNALTQSMSLLPAQLVRSLTWDRGKELSQYAAFTVETGIPVFFTDPAARGSAAPTRTPTACCASTSRRAPTCRDGATTTSKPSLPRSTPDHARSSDGAPPPKPSTITYTRSNKPVLRRPIESAQYRSYDYTQTLDDHDVPGIDRKRRRCLRQRVGGELRRHVQNRVDPRPRLADPKPTGARDRRVRRLVQHHPTPRKPRRHPTRRTRSPSRRLRCSSLPRVRRGNHQTRTPRNPAWLSVPARGLRHDNDGREERAEGVVGEAFSFEFRRDHQGHEGPEVSQVGLAYGGAEHGEQRAGVGEQHALAPLKPQEVEVPVVVCCRWVADRRLGWELV